MQPHHVFQKVKESGKLPNTLTWIRLVLFWVPAVLILSGPHDTELRWWAVVAFLAIVITDKLDGALARALDQVTPLGKIIDPLADKLLIVALVVALCWTDILVSPYGWAFLGINVVREAGVTLLRYIRKRGDSNLVIPANNDGKIKMFLQSVGVGLALIPVPSELWQLMIWVPLIASLFYSWRSGIAYLRAK